MTSCLRLLAVLAPIALLAGLGATRAAGAQESEPVTVSLVQLIATPERYDGKRVLVDGFVWLEFEGDAVYLHKDDYEHALYKNGLWLDVPERYEKQRRTLRGRYALVVARFDAGSKGHFGMWSGGLRDVERLEPCGCARCSPKKNRLVNPRKPAPAPAKGQR